MSLKKLIKLNPYPAIYNLHPIVVGAIGLVFLFGGITFFRLVFEDGPILSKSYTLTVGDPALAVYMYAAATALGRRQPIKIRFYHKTSWYLLVGAVVGLGGYLNDLKNLNQGLSSDIWLGLGHIYHFLAVPVYAMWTVGVAPQIIFEPQGKHRLARTVAVLSLLTWVGTFLYDMSLLK